MIELRPRLTPSRVWWLAARPATLAASVSPVLVGTAVAVRGGHVRPWAGLAALAVTIALQVGVNYANDYSDFVRGADTPRRRGPVRAAASGVVPPRQVRAAAFAAFGVAAAIGLALSLATDWRLLLAGALAVAAGWLYTGGPRPYGYLGLGEVFVFVFFGLLATCGTAYVESGQVGALAVTGGVATGALACSILVLNNLRDSETDRVAAKRTLAVRLGAAPTRLLLAGLLALALVAAVVAFGLGYGGRLVGLPLLTLPLAWQVHHLSASNDPKVLVGAL
ncbi:MAG: 1,4-dihydroxy-2-naphthoate polyprenyltransferase, partial [Chloroflexota bacterium]